ncbi:MAG: cob(I)yrinic acid a,c-diamide adenosyltransferase [Candidatus Hodarchaeota archaeon]
MYFGRGKGKTTAALGQGFRATGHGFKVFMIQFMKGWDKYGEVNAIKNTENFELKQFGTADLISEPKEIDYEEARKALDFAKSIITSDEYDIVILDEIGVALEYKLIDVEDVLSLIDQKPKKVELILTGGPNMHPKIKEKADLLTEMRMIKHYYSSKGITARLGIEY